MKDFNYLQASTVGEISREKSSMEWSIKILIENSTTEHFNKKNVNLVNVVD